MSHVLQECPPAAPTLCGINGDGRFAWRNAAEIGKRHQAAATVVQTSLLLMNYSGAHFSGDGILNGVMRTSSPLCVADLYEVMDLNGNSLPGLNEAWKAFPVYTGRGRTGRVFLSYVWEMESHSGTVSVHSHLGRWKIIFQGWNRWEKQIELFQHH